jgi:putative NADH-flavin reductase
MKILIFGASGATGQELVKQAVSVGHAVTAFVRDPGKINIRNSNLNLTQGNVKDLDRVENAIANQDAVISALGVAKPLHSDPDVIQGIDNIINAMSNQHVNRLIYLSFIAAGDGIRDAGFLIRYIISRIVRQEIDDHRVKEQLIKNSNLNWSIIHPPKLSNGAAQGKYKTGEDLRARSILPILSRSDLAEFMLTVINNKNSYQKTIRIMN